MVKTLGTVAGKKYHANDIAIFERASGRRPPLSSFFHEYKSQDFKKAIAALCRFYHLKNPQVEWYEYIDWGKTAGKTYENGQIYLVHPENWKKGRKYNSE